jgi:[pyruvate, phosphate dikinase]-phosphate phosphotransferase / [pyruvate, phosphate dikinase] kinase
MLVFVSERPIFVVSDSTGETAERLVRAALVQFPNQRSRVRLFTRVRDRDGVLDVVRKAKEAGALLVYTLAGGALSQACYDAALEHDVEAVDVIGPLLSKLSSLLDRSPLGAPGSSQPLSEEYFRRVEAIEFAVKSDDGKEPRNLRRADVVLVGVSRTSKTPLSTYLAGRGLKVANVPLVLGVPPPEELAEVPRVRVVGLTIAVQQLLEIRNARLRQLGMPTDTNYGSRDHVLEELDYASKLYQERGWFVVDVSGRAIEETATIILEHFKELAEQRGGQTIPPPLRG